MIVKIKELLTYGLFGNETYQFINDENIIFFKLNEKEI